MLSPATNPGRRCLLGVTGFVRLWECLDAVDTHFSLGYYPRPDTWLRDAAP